MRPRSRRALAAGGALLLATLAAAAFRGPILDRIPDRWRIALSAWRHGVSVEPRIDVAMPDGTRLAASLYRPRDASGRLPTILLRLPYHRLRHREGYFAGLYFASHGYAVVVQDVRGTGDSGGELLPWRDAREDGVATLEWIARQPWSDGQVGTFGCSGLGEVQFALARAGHSAHRAMVASGAGGAVGSALGRHAYFGVFEGGIFELASGFGWFAQSGAKQAAAPGPVPYDAREVLKQLPVASLVARVRPAPNGYDEFLATPLADPVWSRWGYLDDGDRGTVPALVINTWGDQTVGETLALAEAWRRADPAYAARQKVIVAPATHCAHGNWAERPFGELRPRGEAWDFDALALGWFDHWLRGRDTAVAKWPAYRYFMLNEDRWLDAPSWPPPEARAQRWHLASGGRANSRRGDGTLAPSPPGAAAVDRYRSDPADPVPSRGGPICCTGDPRDVPGPVDQAEVEARDDVLVYTSAPLERRLRIAGPLRARIAFSSDAPDTDLVVRLVDVDPQGRALNIQEGALRLRYRDGFATPRMLTPGEVQVVEVDMRSIAWSVAPGHRLRLDVASSSFPRLERNLQTGAANNALETRIAVAHNAVHHGPGVQSWVELALLPDEGR